MKRVMIILSLLTIGLTVLFAQGPDWLSKRPLSDEYFYGRGEGTTAEDAELSGKEEILLQLSSQVNAVIRLESSSTGGNRRVSEKMEAFFGTARLRTAEVEDRYASDGRYHALVRYPEDCGLLMAQSAILRYQDEHEVDARTVIEQLDEGAMIRAARLDRVLNDVVSGDYGTDLSVSVSGKALVIRVLNFAAYEAELTEGQRRGFDALGRSFFDELERLDYGAVAVEGHANPTGTAGEKAALLNISRARAETMAVFLRRAGITVGTVRGLGGSRLLGDSETEEGRGLNRRVEIKAEVLP